MDRKSVTCSQCVLGLHLIHASVGTQVTLALSSGEAEFTGSVRTATKALGVRSLGEDMGMKIKLIELGGDSTASKGMMSRTGVGRVRHLDVGLLWVQQRVERGEFRLRKLLGVDNSADLGTKDLSAELMNRFAKELGLREATDSHPHRLRVAGSVGTTLAQRWHGT